MPKTKKTALWACVIVLTCMLSYCIVSKVQQYNYIHSEYRTGAMSVQKDPSETFEVRELISEKQRNGGVTLYAKTDVQHEGEELVTFSMKNGKNA